MADYPIIPNRITDITWSFSTNVVTFANGAEQRTANWSTPKKKFKLEHYALTNTAVKTLEAFFDAQKGQYGSFNFHNHVDGQTYVVRFANDEFEEQRINSARTNIAVEVITC